MVQRLSANRLGITLLEVLVCFTICGLLLAIIIPTVQSAREASRRTQCQSKLRGFGQALHGYEGVHRHLPPVALASGRDPITGLPFSIHLYSPHVRLLPFLDQAVLYEKFDLAVPQPDVVNPVDMAVAARTVVAAFNCPSDPQSGGNSYRFCTGAVPRASDDLGTKGGGAFSDTKGHSFAEIRDGTSQTAAMSERRQSDAIASAPDSSDFFYAGVPGSLLPLDADQMSAVCAAQTNSNQAFCPYVGRSWFVAGYVHTLYNHVILPNSSIDDCSQGATGGSMYGAHKSSSHHSSGAHVLFLDGRVVFIGESIDLNVWRAIATRDGRESKSI